MHTWWQAGSQYFHKHVLVGGSYSECYNSQGVQQQTNDKGCYNREKLEQQLEGTGAAAVAITKTTTTTRAVNSFRPHNTMKRKVLLHSVQNTKAIQNGGIKMPKNNKKKEFQYEMNNTAWWHNESFWFNNAT